MPHSLPGLVPITGPETPENCWKYDFGGDKFM